MSVCLQGIQRKRPSEVQSAILRRHLLELTQSFIIPLVRNALLYLRITSCSLSGWDFGPQSLACHVNNFHWAGGAGLSYAVVQSAAVFSQERYMAGLMPLQRSVTPWKVSGDDRRVVMS